MWTPAKLLRAKYEFGYLAHDEYEEAVRRLPPQHRPADARSAVQASPVLQIPAWELPLFNPVARPDGMLPASPKATPYNDPMLDSIHEYLTERYEEPVTEVTNERTTQQ